MARLSEAFLAEQHGLDLDDIGLYPGASGLTGVERIKVGDAFGPETVSQIRIWAGFFEVLGSGGSRRYYMADVITYFSPLIDGPIDASAFE